MEKFSLIDADSNPDAISPDWPVHIEIRDQPEYFDEVLSDNCELEVEEKDRVRRERVEWERDGRFVLFWRATEFQLDRSGRF